MKTLFLSIIGFALALFFKWAGRLGAALHRTDATSARWTVAAHLSLARRLFIGAVASAVLFVASFVAPPDWSRWVVMFGLPVLLLLNIFLGGLAGTSESIGSFLSRPTKWDHIEQQIDMKKRAHKALGRFLTIMLIAVSHYLIPSTAFAGDPCIVGVDETVSLKAGARQEAVDFLKSTIFDYVERMNCSSIVVVKLGSETRFAKRTRLETVAEPDLPNCRSVEPVPLTGEAAVFKYSSNVATGRKEQEVASCKAANAGTRRAYEERRRRFLQLFDFAVSVVPKVEYSRIAASVDYLSRSEMYKHILVITDALDNPRASLAGLTIPDGISVIIILVEPDPKYGTSEESLKQAQVWERKRNVTVVTTEELYPGLWSALAKDER